MKPELTRQIVVRLTDELYAAVEADAEANGRTISQSIRHKLRELLKTTEGGG